MSYVYFIGTHVGEYTMVKIGFTKGSPYARRDDLQCGSPVGLDVLAYAPGTLEDEKRLHRRFAEFREHGEWFVMDGELHNYVWSLIEASEPKKPAPTLYPLKAVV